MEAHLQNKNIAILVMHARHDMSIIDQKMNSNLLDRNPNLIELYELQRKLVINILIFQEFLREISACFFTKELVSEMIEGYEKVLIEDLKFECALTTF